MDRLTPQYIVRKYPIPLPSTLGVTPTPETPAQPLPLPLQTPTLYEGRGFEGVGVGVDVFLPRGYPCHSLGLWPDPTLQRYMISVRFEVPRGFQSGQ